MSQDSPDIRKQVQASRGPQKTLELLIPGLRNYRKLDDLRVADNMLRNQVADKLLLAKSNLEAVRKQMSTAGDYTSLTSIGSVIFQLQQIAGEVRHAEQGYSGWVASITIDQNRLNQLYDNDSAFVASAFDLVSATSPSSFTYDPANPASVMSAVSKVNAAVLDFKQKWSVRMEAVKGVLVKQ
ncbi:MAG TPA: hypothetical protein VLX56_01005 [Nitrososphaerales archaeon]|nr:hypothetical protein [Nitrososphaerales archaeon]